MRVIVSPGVITALRREGGDLFQLLKLFTYAHQGRHLVLFQDHEELSDFLNGCDAVHREAYQRAVAASTRAAAMSAAGASTVIVTTENRKEWNEPIARLDIHSALELLEEPLAVVVENAANDWHFLLKIVSPARREQIQDQAAKNWIATIHGGGSDLPNRLADRRLTEARRLRTFVLFDSDRRHPDELDGSWQPGHQETCEGFQFQQAALNGFVGRFWMLERRSIESYMPRSELAAVAPRDVVDAFFRLSLQARWYFNMKKGFTGDSGGTANARRCKTLYSSVPPADQALLKNGFGKTLANRYAAARSSDLLWDNEAQAEARARTEALFLLI